jgi:protein O-mannosyl-transferase
VSKKKKAKALVKPQFIPPKTPIQARPFPSWHFLAAGLMVTLGLIAYSNSFQVPFQFDDYPNIVENPSIFLKNFSASWLYQLIQVNLKDSTRIFAYFTFALNHYWGGLHVFGYHLVNLLIHISSGLLLYSFLMLTLHLPSLRERYGSTAFPIALFSSLLFLCHPIQTQSVTYIVQRMASMAGLLYLLAMVFYVKGRLASGRKRYLFLTGMVLSYLLGLFTKENVAILPLFIGLYEFCFFQRLDLNAEGKKRIAYWLGSVLLIGVLTFFVWGKRYIDIITEGYQIRDFTLGERVLTQFRVVLYYATLLVWPLPSRLNLDYDFPTSHGLLDPPATLLAILVVAGLVGYAVWRAKKQPLVSYFILWYFGNLVIESSIFPLEMVYEHRLYLPMIGPVVLFVAGIVKGWEKLRTRITDTVTVTPLWIFFLALALLFGIGSFQRNKAWANEVTLWEDCVKKAPKKPRAHSNLGFYLIKAKNPEKGLEELRTALQLDPNYGGAHYNLGLFYQESKQPDKALVHLEQFVRLEPKDPRGYNEIGLIYLEKKRFDEAIRFLKKGSELNPYLETIHANLGNAYLQTNRLDEAMAEYKSALQLNPKLSEVHVKMAEIYAKKGQRELAREEFEKAVETSPSLSEAETHFLQGAAHIEEGAIDEAIKELKVALKLNPNDPRIYNNLGIAYRKKQRVDEALSNYRKALDLDPSFLDARVNLGEIYLQKGMVNEAVSELQQALRLEPNRAEIHNNLGVIFLKRKIPEEAISSFKKALSINPEYGEAYFNLALACYYKKDIPAAASYAKKALDLGYPVDPRFLKVLRISP